MSRLFYPGFSKRAPDYEYDQVEQSPEVEQSFNYYDLDDSQTPADSFDYQPQQYYFVEPPSPVYEYYPNQNWQQDSSAQDSVPQEVDNPASDVQPSVDQQPRRQLYPDRESSGPPRIPLKTFPETPKSPTMARTIPGQ